MKFTKGLFKDTGHVDQPEGTYRHAKNALINKVKLAIVNEQGTTDIGEFDPNSTVLEAIETTTGAIVFFTVDSLGTSRIVYLNGQTLSVILKTAKSNAPGGNDFDLKFSKDCLIEGSYKIDPEENLIVYWTDNCNPPRSLNVTRQLLSNNNTIYGVDPATSPNKNYVDRLNLFPHSGPVPRIGEPSIANGGALLVGTYYLFLAYVDKNQTQTDYVSMSLGVNIVDKNESVLPIERYDGAPEGMQTGKSIVWEVSGINTDYEYLRPVIVGRIGEAVEKAFKINDIDITGDSATVIFSMLEGYEEYAPSDVIFDKPSYTKVKTITQLDNVMYLGNLEGSKDIGYQKYANFIKLSTVTRLLDPMDPFNLSIDNLEHGFLNTEPIQASKENGFRSVSNLSSPTLNRRGYMRDEVYAFYIAFILNDGSMSYAYHIPGREKLTDLSLQQLKKLGNNTTVTDAQGNYLVVDEDTTIGQKTDVDIYQLSNGDSKVFHFYDASEFDAQGVNYWENKNEKYPETDDYDVIDAENPLYSNTLKGKNVRHHRMPTNDNYSKQVIAGNNLEINSSVTQSVGLSVISWGDTNSNASGNILEEFKNPNPSSPPELRILAGTSNFSTLVVGGDYYSQFTQYYGGISASNYVSSAPVSSTKGYFFWKKGSNEWNACEAVITSYDGKYIIKQEKSLSIIPKTHNVVNSFFSNVTAAYFVWDNVSAVYDKNSNISHKVRALGIQLSDVKIPEDIANKVQGFRIYYAERKHGNRRVLGQDLIKNTTDVGIWENADISGCGSSPNSNGSKEDFILSPGTLYSGQIKVGTFHDMYMLHSKKSLTPATHTSHEYNVKMIPARGPGKFYSDIEAVDFEEEDVAPTVCMSNESNTSLFIGTFYSNSSGGEFVHFPLKENCKTYLNGDSIFDGTSLGFGKKIYNVGGESSILLGFKNSRTPDQGDWRGADTSPTWLDTPDSGEAISFLSAEEPVMQIHNLHAFKTDMYLGFDTQELVWTGYEVLGDQLKNFIVQPNGPVTGFVKNFQTNPIFGGDTYIVRNGYRITHRPEMSGAVPRDHKSLFYTICETSINLNFRYEDRTSTAYFPNSPASKVLSLKANEDLTSQKNIGYSNMYTLGVADIKPVIPFPLRDYKLDKYKTRVLRSAKNDLTGFVDNYRTYLALEFKDLPKNRGSLWKLVTLNNLLYMHMEGSLFRTKGKQSIQLSDGTQSYVGSGDIFAQEPDEMVQTEAGYGGTLSQKASIVCEHGYFFVDVQNSKMFLVNQQVINIGKAGLEEWLRVNMPYALSLYGLPTNYDNPINGIGYVAVWDQMHTRILVTKRDLKPTDKFIKDFEDLKIVFDPNQNKFIVKDQILELGESYPTIEWTDTNYFEKSGWTASFDPEKQIWISYHDYVPYFYSFNKQGVLSFNQTDDKIWEHTNYEEPGKFYGALNPFEFEFVFNVERDLNKTFFSFEYDADVFKNGNKMHNPGFTEFYLYNTYQTSDISKIEYMMNVRRVGNKWKINKFRDMAKLITSEDAIYTGGLQGHLGENFGIKGANVAGSVTNQVETSIVDEPMIEVDGMNETINPIYIDTDKPWHKTKKFSDKWLAIKLISSNYNKNSINLYATNVAAKKLFR